VEVTMRVTGSFDKTEKFLKAMKDVNSTIRRIIDSEAKRGVEALIRATPVDSGIAARSWGYKIVQNGRRVAIIWTNDDIENGSFPVAIVIQYGYATGTGGYVQGRDYINPAIRPVFDRIATNVWKAVTSA
jgi:hypothetical protein